MAETLLEATRRQYRVLAELDTYSDPIPPPGPSGEEPTPRTTPDMDNTKSEILEYLATELGIQIGDPAVHNLTKAELLDMIDDADD